MTATMRRYDALLALAAEMADDSPLEQDLVVTNLANTATEWHAARPSDANLYAVGMGMVTPYALGLALARPERRVLALDGDGGIFFEASVLGLMAASGVDKLCVIVFDNGGYVSTGKLPTVASLSSAGVDIAALGRAFGLESATTVRDPQALAQAYRKARNTPGPHLIVAKVNTEQQFVGPLPMDLKENKYRFVRHIEASAGLRILKPSAKEHGAKAAGDPQTAPTTAATPFSRALYDAIKDNGIDFVVGLPCSGFSGTQELLMADPKLRYVAVANEGTGLGLCAGAWLGGLRPAALIENFGLFASAYQLLRGHMSYGIPTLLLTEYRGDTGDQEFFAESGELTPQFLEGMRLNHRIVREVTALSGGIRDAMRWMNACLRPFALLPTYDLTRLR
jgi:sulfopyruvate decarboxylase TPP-binding subunit